MAVGPFSVGYPVLFTSGGDTTSQAFHKHMQEIERIYGCLNALNADKLSADALGNSIGDINSSLTNHINSTSPHPNWKPSVSWSDLTGTKPNLADFGGNLPTNRISGLADTIKSNLPEYGGDGITASSLVEDGYVKFKNGLIIQWGREGLTKAEYDRTGENPHAITFPIPFPTVCFIVTVGTQVYTSNNIHVEIVAQSRDVTNIGFNFVCQNFYGADSNIWDTMYCNYIAIGK